MSAGLLLALTLAGAVVGTPHGEALRWARGRHWYGRLVVTSPLRLCDGQRLHLWASGRPPLDVADVQFDSKTPGRVCNYPFTPARALTPDALLPRRVGGSNGARSPLSAVQLPALHTLPVGQAATNASHVCVQRRAAGGIAPGSAPAPPAGRTSSVRAPDQRALNHST